MLGISTNKRYSGEDVLDGIMQQPYLYSTIINFLCNYGLGQDLNSASMGKSNNLEYVLVFAEKGKQVLKFIYSILYYIPKPLDGKWEINFTILKLSRGLFSV